ncbi:YigZ family protein [Pseudoflavonifractor sp. 524-17]|uniref:YigZ family protein n=1 Tax=Pseudoflavonifractor sp. 524-17 TaxID=2304577 RepID=UPI00137A65C1|nr:YigZ family protein [Pseudoflavonifractor sp. 524-17]NCE63452.1 YigZ family protein [Pseudoflavonifractor sp. 524-17]
MTAYYIPTVPSETEFTEKRSRFIGHVWRVEEEAQARAHIEAMKKQYHDARHNCWCYIIREGGVVRYSDDGEPQGTAGQPMLGVFQKEGITNVCCVVTRYFGGVLLGAGGLVRAYTRSAKDALDAAGVSQVRRWVEVAAPCSYALFERVKLEVEGQNGVLGETEYAAGVVVHALLPEERVGDFQARVTELTAGKSAVQVVGESFQAVPLGRGKGPV